MYDGEGQYTLKVPIYCLDEGTIGSVQLCGLDWHKGRSAADSNIPGFAMAFENGRVQILR